AELTSPGHAVEQQALADFIARGKLATHVRRMKRLYGERRAALLAALRKHLGGMIGIVGGSAGMHLTVALDPASGVADTAVAQAAASLGLALRPLSAYALPGARTPAWHGFVLGYAAVPTRSIDAAVKKLRQAIELAR
ncbi:MAG: PLP-dependent aminotransferase family protein, partial [Rhodocyclales bacterium]|nr:PLP-dependent aminotransferase family protein [Rhodocyclales bacterium]